MGRLHTRELLDLAETEPNQNPKDMLEAQPEEVTNRQTPALFQKSSNFKKNA